MNREQLERLIVDAADGELTDVELQKLETDLQDYPDLFMDYKAIMKLPSIDQVYTIDTHTGRHQKSIDRILGSLEDRQTTAAASFEEVTIHWFRRYALAASLAIFALTSLFSLIQNQDQATTIDSEEIVEEYFYPVEESSVDTYSLYLEELSDEQ